MQEVKILVPDEDYDKLQAYALLLKKMEQEVYTATEREASDYTVEDIVMLGIRDRMAIFRMMQEVG